ncbi:Glucanosyltransferase-domain-containing protein [Aspergillus caelatus]|uniref:1,3-beta-glucanosyltransferase n=2 Tax=Aspergillus subgen. Circumdati TaxID=2720871 RepID=A0A5N6ZPY0_9EURO|nr:Glucanosyltransferase-domain-containing protein [Aspergillus caelatus]KAE8358919.1 Glucanosyltransferase-domain-containing protein [Aspergillus caelatus]KAE8411913.1 Glucanosyltransferase-domain-containing protein [Aspergillus pseudocaelatus]
MKLSSIVAGASLFISSAIAADLDPIIIKGSKFFYKSNDTQFYIRGVAYQQEYSGPDSSANSFKDPLADAEACKRDVPYLEKLGTNTIRVYAIDPKSDHKECMSLLSDAGIYVIADLSSPGDSINRNEPKWDNDLYNRYVTVVDELSQYSNVIGFFAGNEVSNSENTTSASAFVKAAVRDTKQYIKAKNYRPMGVGYATSDDSSIRKNMANYFNCNSADDSIDFWGYNVYSWCGDSNYEKSGYASRTEEFKDYTVPVFFAEYGCNAVQPRKFTEVQALYGDKMADVWSGGIVYMYFQEENNYGLVSVDGNKVSTKADFSYLSKELASATPSGTKKGDYNPTNTALQSCPTVDGKWLATSSPLPPSPNQDLCSCMEESLSCALKDKVSGEQLDKLFGTVCGYDVCDGITTNATTGKYGAYSVCTPQQQLSYAINLYYQNQKAKGNGDKACDFNGAATTQSSKSGGSACSALLKEAGTSGTGTVTSSPTGTAGSGASGGAAASSSGAAGGMIAPSNVNVGIFQLGAYVVTAMVAGAGMIVL